MNIKRKNKEKEEIPFASWPLGVKGKQTRKKVYDEYLAKKLDMTRKKLKDHDQHG
jgi:hypothetical protein